MSKTYRLLALTLLGAFLLILCGVTFAFAAHTNAQKDLKGVWVSTVYNLDYPNTGTTSAAALRQQADAILENCEKMGFNAIFLQVRPTADSFYDSSLFPWSKYCTGQQGVAPSEGFDPLAYWVTEAHKRGLELHAWINPYRITKDKESDWNNLTADHPAKQHPEWVIKHSDGNYYFDPGIPEVRRLVVDGALEIVENYEVDGIHLDDYFYPGSDFADSATYAKYGDDFDNIEDWRRDNVNTLVQMLNEELHEADANLSFGISPAGIWANSNKLADGSATSGNQSYFSHYADSRKWVQEGWLDYICPQIYWQIGYAVADYEILANWWSDVVAGTGVDLYIGLADYRCNESASWSGYTQIKKQLELNDTLPEVKGEIHFRYQSLFAVDGLQEYLTQYHTGSTVTTPTITHIVTFDAGEYGTLTGNATLTITEGKGVSDAPSVQATNGYRFLGWSRDKQTVLDLSKEFITQDVTYYAVYGTSDNSQHLAYLKGYENSTFQPNGNITRAEAASILSRLTEDFVEDGNYESPFQDVAKDAWYTSTIGFAAEKGFIGGYENGTFLPQNPVTRGEFASMLVRFLGLTPSGTPTFTDATTHWAASAIATLAEQGIVGGYEDGTFRPKGNITRAEAAKMVNKALNRTPNSTLVQQNMTTIALPFTDVSTNHWAYYEIVEATVSHVTEDFHE